MQTQISSNIHKAASLLQAGEIVAIPTETVYGLAGNALDTDALVKIFEAKNRPFFDPLIVHTSSLEKVYQLVKEIPEPLLKLAKQFWPGPLTLLLPKNSLVPDLVTSGLTSVGIRIPRQTLTLQLLEILNFPLAAPSANPFGYVSPTNASHVFQQLQGKIPFILDGGECMVGLESTIVGMENDQVTIFRLGGLSVETIEKTVGPVKLRLQQGDSPQAPGMLSSHYAPHKPIIIGNIEQNLINYTHLKVGIISFKTIFPNVKYCKTLSVKGNLGEAAQHLFAAMRELDNNDIDLILSEKFPDEGLGKAINDRLNRASFKRQ